MILYTGKNAKFTLYRNASFMRIFNNFASQFHVFVKRKAGTINHNRCITTCNSSLAGIKIFTMIQMKNNRYRRIFCVFLYSICNIFSANFFIFQSCILEICSSAHKSICKVCTLKNRCGTEHLMNFNRCFCLSYCIYIKSALSKVIFIYSFQ